MCGDFLWKSDPFYDEVSTPGAEILWYNIQPKIPKNPLSFNLAIAENCPTNKS